MIETIESKELRKLDAVLGGKAGVYYKVKGSTNLLISNEVAEAIDFDSLWPKVSRCSFGMKNGWVVWAQDNDVLPFEVLSVVQQHQRYWFNVHDIMEGGMYSFYVRGMDLDLSRVVREQQAMCIGVTLITSKMFSSEGVFIIEDDLLRQFAYEAMPFGGELSPGWGTSRLYTYAQKLPIEGGRGCFVYDAGQIREGRKVVKSAMQGVICNLIDEILVYSDIIAACYA